MARTLRATAEEEGVPSIPILGNGDAYDHRQYWEDIERSGVDSIMVARGGLIKPWIFTEIKERRDWDISPRERLDMIGQLCDYGLEVSFSLLHYHPQNSPLILKHSLLRSTGARTRRASTRRAGS